MSFRHLILVFWNIHSTYYFFSCSWVDQIPYLHCSTNCNWLLASFCSPHSIFVSAQCFLFRTSENTRFSGIFASYKLGTLARSALMFLKKFVSRKIFNPSCSMNQMADSVISQAKSCPDYQCPPGLAHNVFYQFPYQWNPIYVAWLTETPPYYTGRGYSYFPISFWF